jgi:RHS repeat-associated protein
VSATLTGLATICLLLSQPGPYQNHHRWYSPDLGRDLSSEPLLQNPQFTALMARQGLSTSAYAYALNSPLSVVDPDGARPRWDASNRDLQRQIDRLRSTPTGQSLWKTLESAPGIQDIKELPGMIWKPNGKWIAGGTKYGPGINAQCSVITHRSLERIWWDTGGNRHPMDPAAILGHELFHAIDAPHSHDESGPSEIQRRIQEELDRIEGPWR